MYAAISVDAEVPVSFSPPGDVRRLLEAADRHVIPLTWLLYSGLTRPDEVVAYYHDHVLARIPAEHELGLHVHFDDHNLQSYQASPARRRELIMQGDQVLRDRGIRATSFRAGCWCLEASDVPVLEDLGIVVDSSPCPGSPPRNHPGHGEWTGLTVREPYRPSRESLLERGDARLLVVPVCSSPVPTADGICEPGYLDYRPWGQLEPILEWYSSRGLFISIGTHDGRAPDGGATPPTRTMDLAVPYLRARGYEFVTLTEMAQRWLERSSI